MMLLPSCTRIRVGERYHQTDYTIDCNSNAYKAYAVAATVFIFIYPVGVPTFFCFLLYHNRHILGNHAGGGDNVGKW
jgi:hypothetical protein